MRYSARCVVLLLVCAFFLTSGCEDSARHMSFNDAMEKYEWDDTEVREYLFSEYSGRELLEFVQDAYGYEEVLGWVVEDADFDAILDAIHDVYSDEYAEDMVVSAVVERYW